MKRVLKWTLIGLAAAGCWAAVQMARQASGLPAVRQEVVTTQPGVAADAVLVTHFSSDVRCATCVRIERLTRECDERNFAPELQISRAAGSSSVPSTWMGPGTSTSFRTTG
jgi:hypothetical protein